MPRRVKMPGWSVLWLLTLIWVNHWWTVECGLPKALKMSTKTGIVLTRDATRNYFLDILQGATKNNVPLPPYVRTPLAMLKSDINGRITVNFHSFYRTKNQTNKREYWTHRKAFPGGESVGLGTVIYAGGLERCTPNGIPIVWKLYSCIREQDVMDDNRGVKHLVEKRRRKGEQQHRQYRLRLPLFLNEREPTHAFFYWDPVDGFIGLAFDELRDRATMYQAHWNNIDMFAKKRKDLETGYDIQSKCFRREVNREMEYFINKLRASEHLLVKPSLAGRKRNPAERKSNASNPDTSIIPHRQD